MEASDDGLDEELDALMKRYFSNTVSKTLAYLLLRRRRLFGIAPVTMVKRPAPWDLRKRAITCKGISVSVDEVRRLCRHTVRRARDSLYDSLMFGIDYAPKLTPVSLGMNDSERGTCWWFGRHGANRGLLKGHEPILVQHVAQTPELRDLYLEQSVDDEGNPVLPWRQNGIRPYWQLEQEFLREPSFMEPDRQSVY